MEELKVIIECISKLGDGAREAFLFFLIKDFLGTVLGFVLTLVIFTYIKVILSNIAKYTFDSFEERLCKRLRLQRNQSLELTNDEKELVISIVEEKLKDQIGKVAYLR